jgi:hypothetical protein
MTPNTAALDKFKVLTIEPLYVGRAIRVKDDDGTNVWYGTVDAQGIAHMTRSDLLTAAPTEGE